MCSLHRIRRVVEHWGVLGLMFCISIWVFESDSEFSQHLGAEARWGGDFKKIKTKKLSTICIFLMICLDLSFLSDENSIISQQTKWVEFFLRFSDWHAPCIGELVNGCDGSLSARVYHPHIVNILV